MPPFGLLSPRADTSISRHVTAAVFVSPSADASLKVTPPPQRVKRVCVIGAGPSGLGVLSAFKDQLKDPSSGVEVVVFERQVQVGGQWYCKPRADANETVDELGMPIHSSMYSGLWSNGPKETGAEFHDYTYLDHFGRPMPSCLPRALIEDYIRGRASHFDLLQFVRLCTLVENVEYRGDETGDFSVVSRDLRTMALREELFDSVIVAAGHYSKPHFPTYEGFETFPGTIIHAKDFRNAEQYRGKRVLVVGGSLSAEDVALQLFKFGAEEVVISNRTAMEFPFPKGVSQVPILTRAEGSTCHFCDGTARDFDAILMATGYLHDFPFLPEQLRLRTKNVLFPRLYKGVFWPANPKVMYLGMQDQVYTFTMFDLQAALARDAILGSYPLPSREDMEADVERWVGASAEGHKGYKGLNRFTTDYVRELNELTGRHVGDVDWGRMVEMLDAAEEDKYASLLTFRDQTYTSVYSGAMSQPVHREWLAAMDDETVEDYLSYYPLHTAAGKEGGEAGSA